MEKPIKKEEVVGNHETPGDWPGQINRTPETGWQTINEVKYPWGAPANGGEE